MKQKQWETYTSDRTGTFYCHVCGEHLIAEYTRWQGFDSETGKPKEFVSIGLVKCPNARSFLGITWNGHTMFDYNGY